MILEKGVRVGLFFSYNQPLAQFLGYARFDGDKKLSASAIETLAIGGRFNNQRAIMDNPHLQESFILEKNGIVVYGQECWYTDENKTKELLKKSATIEEVDIEALRKKEAEKQKALHAEGGDRVVYGFAQINVYFKMAHVPDGEEIENLIRKKLLETCKPKFLHVNPFDGCSADDIEVKIKEEDYHFCSTDESHGLATQITYNDGEKAPVCDSCYQKCEEQ